MFTPPRIVLPIEVAGGGLDWGYPLATFRKVERGIFRAEKRSKFATAFAENMRGVD